MQQLEPKFSEAYCEEMMSFLESVVRRLKEDQLTRASLECIDTLPSTPGIYMAGISTSEILYVGKSENLSSRCNLKTHHKLAIAVSMGAKYLYVVSAPKDVVWYVEQLLIEFMSPPLNDTLSRWWIPQDLRRNKDAMNSYESLIKNPDLSISTDAASEWLDNFYPES